MTAIVLGADAKIVDTNKTGLRTHFCPLEFTDAR